MDKLTFLLGFGRDQSGQHVVLHQSKPQFCFLGDSHDEVLAKANTALQLYIKHRRAIGFEDVSDCVGSINIESLETVSHRLATA